MRTAAVCFIATILAGVGCASTQTSGALGEGSGLPPRITAVDSSYPPRHASVQLDQPGYAAMLLVAPGHSATLLYPSDSLTDNQARAGEHRFTFEVPDALLRADSARATRGRDTTRLSARSRTSRRPAVMPLPPSTPTYLLLVTSPQPLRYRRIVERTVGVSIPTIELEALNAVAKAIKATIANEPREWAGYYRVVQLRRP